MEKSSQQKRTKEFCEPAVRLVYEQELTIPEAATGLSLSNQTLAGMDSTSSQVLDLEAEVNRLEHELAEARLQCDILKQTVAYFAQVNCPVRGHDDPTNPVIPGRLSVRRGEEGQTEQEQEHGSKS